MQLTNSYMKTSKYELTLLFYNLSVIYNKLRPPSLIALTAIKFNMESTHSGSETSKYIKWWPPSLSVLKPMLFNTGLTYLGSEASK